MLASRKVSLFLVPFPTQHFVEFSSLQKTSMCLFWFVCIFTVESLNFLSGFKCISYNSILLLLFLCIVENKLVTIKQCYDPLFPVYFSPSLCWYLMQPCYSCWISYSHSSKSLVIFASCFSSHFPVPAVFAYSSCFFHLISQVGHTPLTAPPIPHPHLHTTVFFFLSRLKSPASFTPSLTYSPSQLSLPSLPNAFLSPLY